MVIQALFLEMQQ